MLNFEEAYNIVKEKLSGLNPGFESVSLSFSLGRIAAEDIFSQVELPGFDNSAMDGIVVKFCESVKKWQLKGEISAGHFNDVKIKENEAASIMTGAAMISSGDTVIPVEDLNIQDDVAILKTSALVKPLQNVRKKAQDLKRNELILAKYTKIKPKHILLLASAGVNSIKVLKPLRAAVIATGDELADINSLLTGDKVYSSNIYGIRALMDNSQMECVYSGISRDNNAAIRVKMNEAIDKDIDLLITSGGVSMGKYDHVQEVLKELGAEIVFWKLNIKPGKPMLFAEIIRNGKMIFVFGLPGNPVSAYVNFLLLARNAVSEAVYGNNSECRKALLLESISKRDGKRHFIRGTLEIDKRTGRNVVSPLKNQSSSNMAGLSRANALIIFKENTNEMKEGELAECIMM